MYSLDARSGFAWCCMVDGCEPPDIVDVFVQEFGLGRDEAEREVSRIIGELSGLGVLEDRPGEEFQGPVRQPKVVRQVKSPTDAFLSRIKLLDTAFEVGFSCEGLLNCFRMVMGHLETDTDKVDCCVSVHNRCDGYAIVVDDVEVEHCDRDDGVAPQVMSVVSAQAVNRASFAACIHAAVLLVDGRAILVPGPSGTGKSCLALNLARAGFTCLSDEKALVDAETLHVRGVPLACCVKEGAWEAMTALHPSLLEAAIHTRGDGKRVKYLGSVSPEAAARPWPVEHIVFPIYREGVAARRNPLEPEEALRRLLSSCMAWRAPLTPTFVKALISWIEGVQCHELRYGTDSGALAEFSELLGRGDTPREVLPSSKANPRREG